MTTTPSKLSPIDDGGPAYPIPPHQRIDMDAATLLVKRAIAFADWAAGEGICPEGDYFKKKEREEKNPDEFLFAYSLQAVDDEWDTLSDRISAAFRSLDDENGKLKCEINQLKWERDTARDAAASERERCAQEAAASVMKFRSRVNGKYYPGYHEDMRDFVKDAVLSALLTARKGGGERA